MSTAIVQIFMEEIYIFFHFYMKYSLSQLQQQQKSLYPEIWSVKVLHHFMDADLTPTLLIHLIFI